MSVSIPDLQVMGGQILDMPAASWQRVAEAA